MIYDLCLSLFHLDDVIQYTAITWLKEFVRLSGRTMLPFASGIITAVLPCLAYDTEQRKSILLLKLLLPPAFASSWVVRVSEHSQAVIPECLNTSGLEFRCLNKDSKL